MVCMYVCIYMKKHLSFLSPPINMYIYDVLVTADGMELEDSSGTQGEL